MVKTQKNDDIRTAKVPSTKVLFKNPNIHLKILRSAVANDVQKDKTKNSNLIVKKTNKVGKEKKDLGIETDYCILRRIYQEKKRKKIKKKSEMKLPTLASQNSSMVVLKIKHKPRNDHEVPKICTEEDEDIVIDNLRMLINKFLDKHIMEDDEVMTRIKSSFRAVLNSLTGSNINVLTPSLCKLDKSSRSSISQSVILNRQDKEVKKDKEESTDKSPNHLAISKSNLFVTQSETTITNENIESNAVTINVASDVTENKPKIVTKKVKLKKILKDQNIFLRCMDQSSNSIISTASFEDLAFSRKSSKHVVENLKKGSINMTCSKIKIEKEEPAKKKCSSSKEANSDDKRKVEKDVVGMEILDSKNRSSDNVATEDIIIVDHHNGRDEKEIKVEGFSNVQMKDYVNEETGMQDQDEDILYVINKEPSEKTVKFLVEPVKDDSFEMHVSDSLVKSLYGKSADETCRITTNKKKPDTKQTANYYKMLAKSFRNIQRSKVSRTIAMRKTKKNNSKPTRKNECCVLRIECHETKFTEKSLIRHFKKVNDYLSNYKDKGNITLDIVIKVYGQNEKIQSKLKDNQNNFDIEAFKNKIEGNTTMSPLLVESEELKIPDAIDIVQKYLKKRGDFPTVGETEAEPFTNKKNLESDTGNHIVENPRKGNIKTDQKQFYAAINHISLDLQNSLKSVEIINDAILSQEKLDIFGTRAKTKIKQRFIDLFEAINHDKQKESCVESNKIIRTVRDNKAFVPEKTESEIIADIIELLDTSLSHANYLQDSNKSHEIIETTICNEEKLTAVVNESKAPIIPNVLHLLENNDTHLPNFCKSDPNLATFRKSNPLFRNIYSKNAPSKRNHSQESEISNDLSNFKSKLLNSTAAAKYSYQAYEKEHANRIPRNDTSTNYLCLGIATYGGPIVCVEDLDNIITRFSSASELISKNSDDSSCIYRKISSVYEEPSKSEIRKLGDKQSVGTQITTPLPKQTKPSPKTINKSQSYKIIESESVIKVTDMTSGTKYSDNIFDKSTNAKAITCSLPSSRAIFELIPIDHVKESEAVSFVSKEITQRKRREQMLHENIVTEACLPSSSLVDAEDNSTRYKQDEIFSCNDFACSHSLIDSEDRIPGMCGANHLCYFLTTNNDNRELQDSSSFAIEMESSMYPIEQKFIYQTTHVTKMQAFFCCTLLFLVLASIAFYFLYVHIYNPEIKTKFKVTKTFKRSTTPLFDLKEMGLR